MVGQYITFRFKLDKDKTYNALQTTKNYDFQPPRMFSISGSGAALVFAWDQLIGHRKDGDQTPGGKFDIKN